MEPEDALALAVVSTLRTANSWSKDECDLEILSEAPPMMRDFYIAVMPAGYAVENVNTSDVETHSVDVYVARRVRKLPRDRRGNALHDATVYGKGSLSALVRGVRDGIGNKATVYTTANTNMNGVKTPSDPDYQADFYTPLRMQNVGPIQTVTSHFIGAREDQPIPAVMRVLRFTGAQRIECSPMA